MAKAFQAKRKGREIAATRLPGDPEMWKRALEKEWTSWIRYGTVELLEDDEQQRILREHPDLILKLRVLHTDKNEVNRGPGDSIEDVPIIAKCRLICDGYNDTKWQAGEVDTASPTLPREGLTALLQTAVNNGWAIWIGDVETAFMQGANLDRAVYLRAPPQGLPEVTLDGVTTRAIAPNELMLARKAAYGMPDA